MRRNYSAPFLRNAFLPATLSSHCVPVSSPASPLRRAFQRPPPSLGQRSAVNSPPKMLATAIRPAGLSEETTQYRPAKDLESFKNLLPPPIEFVEGSSKGALLMDETKYRPINASPEETEVRLYHFGRRCSRLILARRPQSPQSPPHPPRQGLQSRSKLHNPSRRLGNRFTMARSTRRGPMALG